MPAVTSFITDNDTLMLFPLGMNGSDAMRPFYAGGHICTLFYEQVVGDYYATVWASTDNGATWAAQDTTNRPAVTNSYSFGDGPLGAVQVGSSLVVAYFAAGTGEMALRPFDMASLTWGAALATGGPTIVLPIDGNDTIPVKAINIVQKGGVYTMQYRSANASGYSRTSVIRWSAADGWGAPIATFGSTAGSHYENRGGYLDSSGGFHLLGAITGNTGPNDHPLYHQHLAPDDTLTGPTTIEAHTTGAPRDTPAVYSGFLHPKLIGQKIYFGAVAHSANVDDDFSMGSLNFGETPSVNIYNLTKEPAPTPAVISESVESSKFWERFGGNVAVVSRAAKVGIVTAELDDNDVYSFFYHDLSSMVTGSQKLALWPHYRNEEDPAETAKLWGAYFDDDGNFTDAPFVVYTSTTGAAPSALMEIHSSDPGGTFPYSYLGHGGRASFAGTGPFSLMA